MQALYLKLLPTERSCEAMRQPVSRQKGFSLVELMIALVLGLFLVGGILYVFISNSQTFRTNEALSRMQENGRFAIDFISRDIREAGYNAVMEVCGGAVSLVNEDYSVVDNAQNSANTPPLQPNFFRITLNNPEDFKDTFLDSFRRPENAIYGYNGAAESWQPNIATLNLLPAPQSGTDIISIRKTSDLGSGGGVTVINHPGNPNQAPGSANLEINPGSGIARDDILMVLDKDCTVGAAFQVSANVPATSPSIQHNTGSGTPGNRTNSLGRDFTGGMIFRGAASITTTLYFIALDPNNNNQPALYRRIDDAAPEPLVEGVENMQILYGRVDAAGNLSYETANNVADWDDVVSARISLLVRSTEANVTTEPQTLTFPPAPDPSSAVTVFNDQRIRHIFTTTIALRNRLP